MRNFNDLKLNSFDRRSEFIAVILLIIVVVLVTILHFETAVGF